MTTLPCDSELPPATPSLSPSAQSLWWNYRTVKASYNALAVKHSREMIEWFAAHSPSPVLRETAAGMMRFLGRYA